MNRSDVPLPDLREGNEKALCNQLRRGLKLSVRGERVPGGIKDYPSAEDREPNGYNLN